ncbi:hypothetical protein [Nonomuraea basaltis]|uniref:hypothetical protein n=1 Tax=Nonomuraea basaltis TaxID=2495887 RepID=UPI00110C6ECB|nr:hypothetical protein [Nonomuraea basaltis]TMR91157.1 hypothetical protein EJK15_51370 [Nonomuraea basaltis]
MTTFPRLVAFALLAGLAAACAPASGYGAGAPVAAAGQANAAPPTVEGLAAKVGCEPRMQVNGPDTRTGHCKTPDGEFFVNTFRTQAGQDAWMEAAPVENPHLAGNLWTVLADRKVLDLLGERLGGELHQPAHGGEHMQVVG